MNLEHISSIINSLATLLWPVIFLYAIIKYSDIIHSVFKSINKRKITVKVAGNELTMEELTKQQQELITDLQIQVSKLKEKSKSQSKDKADLSTKKINSILWVDDNIESHSYIISSLEQIDITVYTVNTTIDALKMLTDKKIDVVITDSSRIEDNAIKKDAGLELIEKISLSGLKIPVIVFSSISVFKAQRNKAFELGAYGFIYSYSSLFELLNLTEIEIEGGGADTKS